MILCFIIVLLAKLAYSLEPISSFGFVPSGSFNLSLSSSLPGYVIAFLSTDRNFGYSKSASKICANNFISSIELHKEFQIISTNNFTYHWSSSILNRGVYYFFIEHCNSSSAKLMSTINFKNGISLLDYRENGLPFIFFITSGVYCLFSIIWLVNAAWFPRFRVPIHTLFLSTSIIHTIISVLRYTVIGAKAMGLVPPKYKEYLISIFCCIRISIFFPAISLVAAGYCVFRSYLPSKSLNEILLTSFEISISIICLPYASDFSTAFLLLALLFGSFACWMKISTINIVMICKLQSSSTDEYVSRKIILVKAFLQSQSYAIGIIIIGSILSISTKSAALLSACLKEIGLIIASFYQLYFFLLRKEYCGEIMYKTEVKVKPIILYEPGKSRSYAILSNKLV